MTDVDPCRFQNDIERELWLKVFAEDHKRKGEHVTTSGADCAVAWLRFRSKGLDAEKEETNPQNKEVSDIGALESIFSHVVEMSDDMAMTGVGDLGTAATMLHILAEMCENKGFALTCESQDAAEYHKNMCGDLLQKAKNLFE